VRDGKTLPAEARLLAGLTRVRYVLFDPKRHDVILAGPAEPWTVAPGGEVVGTESGRPVLHLEDLIAALRYEFPPGDGVRDAFIGCSIDPTPEGVQRYNAFLRNLRGIDRRRVAATFAAMEQAMGPQSVRVFGVPATTRLAQVMVAADYRLKRIALAHDPSPVREVVSYLDLEARTFRGQAVPQHRWWFVAGYDTLWQAPDGLGFEFDGTGVRVETARSAPGQPDGQDEAAEPPATRAARQFAESFTKHFAELATKQPAFAELANVIGLSAAAALIGQKQDGADAAAHWRPTIFLDDARCPLPEHPTPSQTPALAS
jgi:hypothetical protein